jgi:hypothetical protein
MRSVCVNMPCSVSQNIPLFILVAKLVPALTCRAGAAAPDGWAGGGGGASRALCCLCLSKWTRGFALRLRMASARASSALAGAAGSNGSLQVLSW